MMDTSRAISHTQNNLKHEDVRKVMDDLAQVIENYLELMA